MINYKKFYYRVSSEFKCETKKQQQKNTKKNNLKLQELKITFNIFVCKNVLT